jgi:hypothetical protein
MFPPTPDQLASEAQVHGPTGVTSPGAAWLMATATRAAEVQQQIAEGHCRDALLTLHAHYAIEDPRHDLHDVAADLELPLCHHAHGRGHGFAVEVALFRVARSLLDKLTAVDVDVARAA